MSWSSERATRRGRWTVIVVGSVLAHLALIDALPRWIVEPGDTTATPTRLRVLLVPTATVVPEPVATASPEPVAPPKPKPKPVAKVERTPRPPRPKRTVVPPPDFVPEALDANVPSVAVATPDGSRPTPSVRSADDAPIASTPAPATDAGAAAAVVAAPAPPPPTAPPPPATPVDAPTSARLVYRVVVDDEKNFNTVHYYGKGTIDFVRDGDRYRSDLRAAADFLVTTVDVLVSHSEGSLDANGLAPDRYTETPRKRATISTNFNRDARRSVTFSASQATVPLPAGVQDRLSILFQVGGLLRGNPALTAAGSRFDVPVAGVRGDVDTWTFETIGNEEIEPGIGRVATVHLRRTPKPGGNDRTIDVWVALAAGGYPARVLYTEPNGSTYDLMLDRIEALPTAPS